MPLPPTSPPLRTAPRLGGARRRLRLAPVDQAPVRLGHPVTFRRGALLEVAPGCEALLVHGGRVVARRSPGLHRLDPDDDLSLADLLDRRHRRFEPLRPAVVDTRLLAPWAFHGALGGGPHHAVGHLVVRVSDGAALLHGLLGRVELAGRAHLGHWLGHQALVELTAVLGRARPETGGRPGPPATDGPVPDVALAAVAEGLGRRLGAVGLTLEHLGPVDLVRADGRARTTHRAPSAARRRPSPGPRVPAAA
jgi:hypothetical protein